MPHLLIAWSVLSAGCGTHTNLVGANYPLITGTHVEAPTPFGGVKRDLRWSWSVLTTPWREEGGLTVLVDPVAYLALGVFAVDLPVSFVGDVITMPKAIHIAKTEYGAHIDLPPVPDDDAPQK